MRACLWCFGGLLLLGGACSSKDSPPPFSFSETGGTGGGFNTGTGSSGSAADSGVNNLCGNEVRQTAATRPNLYFLIDRSGSMADTMTGSSLSKYAAARKALSDLLFAVGHRVAYGAAIFPGSSDSNTCQVGKEVFSVRAGDSVTYAQSGEKGPVLRSFNTLLSDYTPAGGTPVSDTITALTPKLLALQGTTAVVLATDGSPNCNEDATCSKELCAYNLAGVSLPDGRLCSSSLNCCDPKVYADGPLACIDDPGSVAAVETLASAGIKTYVVGLPSDDLFQNIVLSDLAYAGGTVRSSGTAYYAVADSDELAVALRSIVASIAIPCTITLASEPEDFSLVNVYLDGSVIPSSTTEGWSRATESEVQALIDAGLLSEGDGSGSGGAGGAAGQGNGATLAELVARSITVHGASCTSLQGGDVYQVQVAVGCPTVVH